MPRPTQRLAASWVIETRGDDLAPVRKGATRLAEIADAIGVPLTWAVDTRSARSLSNWLNERREQRRLDAANVEDEPIIVWLDVASWLDDAPEPSDSRLLAERRVRERETLRDRVAIEKERVVDALPWARPTIAGADSKTEALLAAIGEAGFTALWGYRWNEASPRSQDRGCPFGFFYASRDRFQSAGPPSTGIVGIPRDVGDLRFRRSTPSMAVGGSPDDDPMLSARESLAPLSDALERIASGTAYNLWFGIPVPTRADAAASWSSSDSDELVNLWTRMREMGIEAMTLRNAVAGFRERFGETEPTTLVWSDADERGNAVGKCAFHYDARAQYVFDDGILTPVEFANYVTPSSQSRYLSEYEPPSLVSFVPTRERERLRLDFTLDSPKPMPYALCLWGDHRHLRLLDTNALELRAIGSDGMLVSVDLVTGANDFYIALTI